ncbi:50S ribosomal protein L23-like [Mangifera indica]|uniref:50S ribosomal protein L23-like n=1 Tax=Mangifera indica TaxID=29780 RepID=UPI001CFB8C7E|nr:50S ribosomal protein L23-like [Mangifera indica]
MIMSEVNQIRKMGNGLLDLPMQLLMSSSIDNVKEIAFKTISSVSKVDIKTCLESTYRFEVKKVRTLNMQGKKKRRNGRLVVKPNYKKAYITLKNPISIASDTVSKGNE